MMKFVYAASEFESCRIKSNRRHEDDFSDEGGRYVAIGCLGQKVARRKLRFRTRHSNILTEKMRGSTFYFYHHGTCSYCAFAFYYPSVHLHLHYLNCGLATCLSCQRRTSSSF
ncbi:unnamed protein product [Amoebophrya sp. A120]|nr:unnamed protein product [Amoebophrya sp. A120]|eukprot:GSA120T00002527001.1